MKTALYAGSFDPFTNGHLSIVKEACEVFDKVYLCIANNSAKVRFIPVDKMVAAIKETITSEGLDNCEVVICDKMIADFCAELDINYLIRGLRNTSDYMYEENIAKINNEINPNLKTIYFRAENETISSSLIRELLKYNKNVEKYVPQSIYSVLS